MWVKGHVGQSGALLHALLCPVTGNHTLPDHEPETLKNYIETHCLKEMDFDTKGEAIEIVYTLQDNQQGCVLTYTAHDSSDILGNIWGYLTLIIAGMW